jgi:transglutaminase-like putative cysteine protease
MRIAISHATTYRYASPPRSVTQALRLTPRNHDGQYVVSWLIDVSHDCQLHRHEDAFGNLAHTFTADGPFTTLTVSVEGLVETQDLNGVLNGTVERFPTSLYLRETALTTPDAAIIEFAERTRDKVGAKSPKLELMHQMVRDLHGEITFDTDPTSVGTTASEAYTIKRGVCQDIAHIYIAAARHLGIPARYVSGYFHRIDGVINQDAGHAWVESYVDGLGWVAFDPTNGISATDSHVRVAVGLDYLTAAPVRGTRFGGGGEKLDVAIVVAEVQQLQAQQ